MSGLELIPRFRGCPVLVVGDLMLDEFIWGSVARISPEAPVPVVEVQRRTHVAGGAANAAANVAALGGRPVIAGLTGSDANGYRVAELLREAGVSDAAVVRDAFRPTTTKTRVLAQGQQMLRVDQETPGALHAEYEDELLARIASVLPGVRGCVLSDYGKGVVTPRVARELIERCQSERIPVVVDPKGVDYAKYCGATVVKPNQLEAGKVLNRDLRGAEDVRAAGRDLAEQLQTSILITQGAAGMSLFERGRVPVHVPAQAREVFDVTGAGDTVAGTMVLALAAGASLETACRLASAAAAVVVGKVGTATVSPDELHANLGDGQRQAA
ncbi:MAG: D-glycero-beta-D-manno-heptose-7-phosphate kinase [Gemmataceae bacterium]|nr:D-glycero-beta-D-manno-heptose-7-phosphate kinase [Gemmataceae bacterium]